MVDGVIDTIRKYSMIQKGDKILVGVSGGPDSISLLNILYTQADKLGIKEIGVAHVNHLLRGAEADGDQEYVRSYCKKRNIPFYLKRMDVTKLSKDDGVSFETAGRNVRYDFFAYLKEKYGYNKIAIAHNANDLAETVIMRLIRGAGIEGLIGIKPVRDDVFIRPLINTKRSEIEEYLKENSIEFRIDKTNFDRDAARNKIRLDVIPYIQKNLNENVVKTIDRLSENLLVDSDYFEKETDLKFKKYCDKKDGKVIIYKEAFSEHKAIVSRIIRKALTVLTGSTYNFEQVHVYEIIELQSLSTGKMVSLPRNVNVSNSYGDIILGLGRNKESKNAECLLKLDEINKFDGYKITFEKMEHCPIDKEVLGRNNFIKYFDFDKISGDIILRYRKEGDRFVPLGMKESKKIKNLFIDLKVPKEEREKVPVLCFGKEIAWIVGYTISDKFKVDKSTKNALKIIFEREEQN